MDHEKSDTIRTAFDFVLGSRAAERCGLSPTYQFIVRGRTRGQRRKWTSCAKDSKLRYGDIQGQTACRCYTIIPPGRVRGT